MSAEKREHGMELVNQSERTGHGVLSHFAKLQKIGAVFTEVCAIHGAEMTIKKIQQFGYGSNEITVCEDKSGMCGLLTVWPYKIKTARILSVHFARIHPICRKASI